MRLSSSNLLTVKMEGRTLSRGCPASRIYALGSSNFLKHLPREPWNTVLMDHEAFHVFVDKLPLFLQVCVRRVKAGLSARQPQPLPRRHHHQAPQGIKVS